jgi:hypothetical protein
MKKIKLTQNKYTLVDAYIKAAKQHFGEFYNEDSG